MRKLLTNICKWIFRVLSSFLIIAFLYLLAALILTIIPANSEYKPPVKGIEIFIFSNGVHTDICLPTKTDIYDWSQFIPQADTYNYIAFGWGEREFYLHTPTWADLKLKTLFRAAFVPSPSLMCVAYYRNKPTQNKQIVAIKVSTNQLETINSFIKQSFRCDSAGGFITIPTDDVPPAYFEATGKYSLFNTCNSWTNKALKSAGIKTAIWAPFDKCVFYHIR